MQQRSVNGDARSGEIWNVTQLPDADLFGRGPERDVALLYDRRQARGAVRPITQEPSALDMSASLRDAVAIVSAVHG